jgi:uncharacterized protein YbjQ (UPF0145 family)
MDGYEILIQVALFAGPLLNFGVLIGRNVEKSHIKRLDADDELHRDFLITQLKSFPMQSGDGPAPTLVVSEAVIASDYLKSWLASWLASWRNIFGGEVRSFQKLQSRAKREALVRLRRAAMSNGYNALCNVRVDSADIGGGTSSRKTPMASVIASGTAYCVEARSATAGSTEFGAA